MSRWQPGQSGNPKGRPAGSKHKLSEAFIEALYADWQEHGCATIAKVREQKPDQYLKVVASIVPRDISVAVDPFEDMSDEELRASIAVLRDTLREQGIDLDDKDDTAQTH